MRTVGGVSVSQPSAILRKDAGSRQLTEIKTLPDDSLLSGRFEMKAVVPTGHLQKLIDVIPDDWTVLALEGVTSLQYESVYFDTHDLQLFRAHRQGRTRRVKIRTRRYSDGTVMLEVKLRLASGKTEKIRALHAHHGVLDASSLAFINDITGLPITYETILQLRPLVRTAYTRTMYRSPDGTERVTVDADLTVGSVNGAEVSTGMFVVEVKSPHRTSTLAPALRRRGVRPVKLSKFAVAVFHTQNIAANPWLPAIRRLNFTP